MNSARWQHGWMILAAGMTAALGPATAGAQSPPAPAQAPAPAAPKAAEAPAADPDDPWEERKLRAREDVAYLEALLKAKQAEYHEAEIRYQASSAHKVDIDRQKQKGYASAFVVNQSALSIAEHQSQLEMRRVEQKDAEIRLARARRRLRAVERSPSAYDPETLQAQTEDRFRDLELRFESLRRDFERAQQVINLNRNRP
jgi:hypothetical protein